MKKFARLFPLFLMCMAALPAFCQHAYRTGVGVRVAPVGFTVKHFLADRHAAEGLLQFSDSTLYAAALYEAHQPIQKVAGMQWYVGPGMAYRSTKLPAGRDNSFGVKAALGVEYTFTSVPVNAGVDWVPQYFFKSKSYDLDWFNLAIRYVLR